MNDLLDEIDFRKHNRKMFVSFVNNDGLRFYQSDPARRQDKVDVLEGRRRIINLNQRLC